MCVCVNGGQGKIFRCEKQIRGLNVASLRLVTGEPASTCSGSQNLRILVPGPAQGLRNLQLQTFLKTSVFMIAAEITLRSEIILCELKCEGLVR